MYLAVLTALVLAASVQDGSGAPALDRLIHQLGSDEFTQREAASRALDRAGEAALPALRKALASPDPDVRRRAGELVKRIEARLRARWHEELATAVRALGGNAGVMHSEGPDPVRWLFFPSTAGDADVARMSRLPGAAYIGAVYLGNTRVTDSCMPHLARFRNLRALWLNRTAVTGSGLGQLRRLQLDELYLGRTAIRDRDLARLRQLAALESLELRSTRVTDAGLTHLRALPRLRSVDLRDTAVTDRGVVRLRGMPDLYLDLRGTKVSAAVAAEFDANVCSILTR
jgi:hypothetical protein